MEEDMPGACAICAQVRQGGYIDAGPADILCLECARAVARAYQEAENMPAVVCPECGERFPDGRRLNGHRQMKHLRVAGA
ncbi:MAG TPA: YgiT-type zinc finger protein [Gemmatimonadales bacterium]